MMWLQFFISALLIALAGFRLTVYADVLSDRLHLSKIWIGLLLLGIITSLPEAVTSLFAVAVLKAPDLAVGNMLGSNNFNPMIIVVMDFLYRQGSVTNAIQLRKSHIISAILVIILSVIVVAELSLSTMMRLPAVGFISYGSILIAIIYLAGIRFLSTLDTPSVSGIAAKNPRDGKLSHVFFKIFLSAGVVVFASMWLTNVTDTIARETGLGRMFAGTLFLALATSFPEIVVSVSALKLGVLDLAFGNIFGSNMANIFILFLVGLFYPQGPLLASVARPQVLSGLLSILLCCLILLGIHLKKKKTVLRLGWDSLLMLLSFILTMKFLYNLRG